MKNMEYVGVRRKMKRYKVICNEGTSFLSRTWKNGLTEQEVFDTFEDFYETEGIGEEEMPKDLDYIRDLWNVTIEEIELKGEIMARQLNKEQKEILDKFGNINSINDLPHHIYWSIIELNDFETIYQVIDMYLWDNTNKGKLNVS